MPKPQIATPTMPIRRQLLTAALVGMPTLWQGARAQPAPVRRATPAQSEGQFYPMDLPKDIDFDLLRNSAQVYTQGQPTWLDGSVTDLAGRPVAGAVVEIWQCDEAGQYLNVGSLVGGVSGLLSGRGKTDKQANAFQGFGRVAVDSSGSYRFRTIRPAAYSGRTPHIHVKVKLGNRELLTTQLYVAGDAGNARDFLWRGLSAVDRDALTVPFVQSADGLRASFAVVVAA